MFPGTGGDAGWFMESLGSGAGPRWKMMENMVEKTGAGVKNALPELLAPAGHVESFHAALENGADAVYLGLKRLSARATATNFSLEELSFLVPYAHRRKAKVYVALNSLVAAPEVRGVLDLLQSLSDLRVDALIVQDPGLFHMARTSFPQLPLHASTLMTVHNSAGVNQLKRMGARRVVLARELTLEEIKEISEATDAPLEVFVHGALCFSYSGMCLASSFRGGRSGLRGECVQPCRLRFHQGRNEGFYLSCNDQCALPLVPRLKRMRVSSLKIEGRMKQADYIGNVVKAYRIMLDATKDKERNALDEAQELLNRSPSRRLTSGYFKGDYNAEILTPHRSGSSGLWIGTVKAVKGAHILVSLRSDLLPGDRLRPESGEAREKAAFTVTEILSGRKTPVARGRSGENVFLASPGDFKVNDRLFKVGSKTGSVSGLWQQIKREIPAGAPYATRFSRRAEPREVELQVPAERAGAEETLTVCIGAAQDFTRALQTQAQLVTLVASKSNLERIAKQRLNPAQRRRLVWSLPPVLFEKDLHYYRLAVKWFIEKGYVSWEVNNWGNFDLFKERDGLNLTAGFRFNSRNDASIAALADEGCRRVVLSLEITREELERLSRSPLSAVPVVPVHAWPPLFTSRLVPRLSEEKPFRTPRKENYFFRKKWGYSHIYADQPMNWFDKLPILRGLGYRDFLADLSDGPDEREADFEGVLRSFREARAVEGSSLFNFERTLRWE